MICVANVDDIIEDCAKGLEVNNFYLIAVKKDSQVYLYWNRCPHLGTPLEWEEDRFLDNAGELIQCSTHGALFRIETGQCVAGPCQGQYLQSVPFTLVDGLVMVEDHLLRAPQPL
jgi:nitrite reductase/ring-hydroxylating ferredoxin subunit